MCRATAAAAAASGDIVQFSGPPQNGILGSTCIYECVTLTYLSFSLWFRARQLESLLLGRIYEINAKCLRGIGRHPVNVFNVANIYTESHRETVVVLFDSSLCSL